MAWRRFYSDLDRGTPWKGEGRKVENHGDTVDAKLMCRSTAKSKSGSRIFPRGRKITNLWNFPQVPDGESADTAGKNRQRENAGARIMLLHKARRMHRAWVLGVARTRTGSKWHRTSIRTWNSVLLSLSRRYRYIAWTRACPRYRVGVSLSRTYYPTLFFHFPAVLSRKNPSRESKKLELNSALYFHSCKYVYISIHILISNNNIICATQTYK